MSQYPPRKSATFSESTSDKHPTATDGMLYNDTVQFLRWENLSASLPADGKHAQRFLLHDMSGEAKAGDLVAIMGPSGSGKSMLLNRLAHRGMPPKAKLSGFVYINDSTVDMPLIRDTSSYVEQEDHLIGSITAKETLRFAARLGLKERLTAAEMRQRIDMLLSSFGLTDYADTIIGTPIQKGLSGGQQRRVSVASQLITSPKILFLDEPTTGLDSVASYEVMSYLKVVAKRNNLVIIASIHQPSTSTFNQFDTVYLLAKGHICYGGPRSGIANHFHELGFDLPPATNPAEWILELVDTDFSRHKPDSFGQLDRIIRGWQTVRGMQPSRWYLENSRPFRLTTSAPGRSTLTAPFHLLHRNWIKSYRDLIPYWVRVAMYTCLAILMGTCWLRLGHTQDDIQPRITAIFFGGAFLSFMAVAYIPAYIEDQATFFKERANGLYGPTSFLIANFLIGLPYLALISVLFSVIAYWLVNLWPTARGFWVFVSFLFLDLLAAESLVVLVSSIIPNFVVSLALVAFANGLWMCVNGFLVPETILNVFWRSWVTKIDYQNWVFRAMMWNEFHEQEFTCASTGVCAFPPGPDGETIPGLAVLKFYGYTSGRLGAYAGYILAVMFTYRTLAWLVLMFRK